MKRQTQKNVRKNPRKNVSKNVRKIVNLEHAATLPVKPAVPANKGSDLLLLGSNNGCVAGGPPASRPLPFREGQVVYLRPERRSS